MRYIIGLQIILPTPGYLCLTARHINNAMRSVRRWLGRCGMGRIAIGIVSPFTVNPVIVNIN